MPASSSPAMTRLVVVAAVVAVTTWLTSNLPAQSTTPAPQPGRYMLEAASEGSVFKIDTVTGETWTLAPANVDSASLRQWIPIPESRSVARFGGTTTR